MNPGLAPIREPRSIFVSPYSLAPAEPLFDSPIPYLLAKAASTYSLVPAHREAASLLTGKLHHFPLGSCSTFHWKASLLPNRKLSLFPTGIFLTSTTKLPYFPPGSFPSSHQEASSPLFGKFPHFPLGSVLSSHRETLFLPTRKLPPLISGSCITFHQEASSLFKLI